MVSLVVWRMGCLKRVQLLLMTDGPKLVARVHPAEEIYIEFIFIGFVRDSVTECSWCKLDLEVVLILENYP